MKAADPGKHSRRWIVLAAAIGFAAMAGAQSATPAEVRAERALAAAKNAGKPALYAFLKPFPKGADLHMHLSGAVYAETFLDEAAQLNLCVDPMKLALANNIGLTKSVPPEAVCAPGAIPATAAIKDQALYDKLIDAFSMRSFVPFAGFSGHDQFFATFSRWNALEHSSAGEWLDEVATRAAAQNEQYLEIMQTPSFGHAAALGYKVGWPADVDDENHMAVLAKVRDQLLTSGLREEVGTDEKELAEAQASRVQIEFCGGDSVGPVTLSSKPTTLSLRGPKPACFVTIHWLYQVLRGFPPQQVFAQTLLGFEVASADPDVVGINFVMPEDGRISMQDYHLQMLMLDYLHSVYPKVHISLHAGEVAPGLVPPDGLTFHIREAVGLGHAERIGHGVDVLFEDNPAELIKEMATKHVDVEVNLTSNDVILGIKNSDHSLAAYRAAHVPFSLSTDDEGVSRIDLTHEYARAVMEQGLNYADLKYSARNSLEYSFLHGASLWAATGTAPQTFAHRLAACTMPITTTSHAATACRAFLDANEKASAQYELERRFAVFEASGK